MKKYKTLKVILLLIGWGSIFMASPWLISFFDHKIETTPMATLRGDYFQTMTLEYHFLPIKIVGEDKIWLYSMFGMLLPGAIAFLGYMMIKRKQRRIYSRAHYEYYH